MKDIRDLKDLTIHDVQQVKEFARQWKEYVYTIEMQAKQVQDYFAHKKQRPPRTLQ